MLLRQYNKMKEDEENNHEFAAAIRNGAFFLLHLPSNFSVSATIFVVPAWVRGKGRKTIPTRSTLSEQRPLCVCVRVCLASPPHAY